MGRVPFLLPAESLPAERQPTDLARCGGNYGGISIYYRVETRDPPAGFLQGKQTQKQSGGGSRELFVKGGDLGEVLGFPL